MASNTEVPQDFSRRFTGLALTNVMATLMVPLAGLVDIAFLGHLEEIRHLAGVALATVLFDTIYWAFGFLRMGTTGMTAQAFGREDAPEVNRIFLRGLGMALALGGGILVLQWPLRETGFWLLQGAEAVEAAGLDYWSSRIWAAPFALTSFVLLGWFLGQERGGVVLLLSAVGNLSNVALDYLFIVQMDMGAGGAGLATAFSQVMVCGVGGVLLLGRVRELWRLRGGLWEGGNWRAMWALNRDLMFRTLLLLMTLAAFTNLGSMLGTTVLAANAVLLKVQLLAAYIVDGLAYATEALAGIFWGEGRRKDLKRLLMRALAWGVGIGVLVALVFSLFPAALYGLLTDHPEVTARLLRDTWWLVPVLTVGSAAYIFDGYFIGLTRGRILYRSMFVSTLVGFCPFAVAAWAWESSDLLWAAMVAWICLRTLTLASQLRPTWQEPN